MSMRINNNLMALNTYNNLNKTSGAQEKSTEKLSSGLRINRAGDDAAGLAISEKMRGQIRGLDQASRNAQDGISMIQTAEGALSETHSILQRMRELSVEASNDTMESSDRTAVGTELKELAAEVDRIATTTEFNGKKLLNGSLAGTSVDAASAVKVGTALATTAAAAITGIDASKAQAGTTYTFTDDGSGAGLTLTRNSDSVAQTIAIEDTIGADGKTTLNFDELGISLEITGAAGKTDDDIVDDLDTLVLTTSAASTTASFAVGANEGQTIELSFGNMGTSQLGTDATNNINTLVAAGAVTAATVVDTSVKAQALITVIDDAIEDVSSQRSLFGAAQNRLEHTISNLSTSSENLTAAESRIRDVDMAKEMMQYTKNNILSQAAQSMLAQANQAPQGVLSLLQQ